jgi:hypothetical protein
MSKPLSTSIKERDALSCDFNPTLRGSDFGATDCQRYIKGAAKMRASCNIFLCILLNNHHHHPAPRRPKSSLHFLHYRSTILLHRNPNSIFPLQISIYLRSLILTCQYISSCCCPHQPSQHFQIWLKRTRHIFNSILSSFAFLQLLLRLGRKIS